MDVTLNEQSKQIVCKWLAAGRYQSVDDALSATIATLDQQFQFNDFAPGELDALIAEADADIESGNLLDGEAVFDELLRRTPSSNPKP